MSPRPARSNVCFVALWLFLSLAGRTRLLRDPGTLWHTVAGEWMLDHRQTLKVDVFGAPHFGERWIPLQWLSECLMAVAYRLGGFDLLWQLAVLFLAGLYTWVYVQLRREHWNWLAAACAVVLAVWASAFHFHVRPHLITIGLAGLTFHSLSRYERPSRAASDLLWMLPVFALWVNLHPGVYAGIALVGFAVAGWSLLWLLGRDSPVTSWRDLRRLVLLAAALCLTPFANPYGWELPQATFSVLDSPVVRKLILEHVALDPRDSAYWGVLALGSLYAWTLLRQGWGWRPVRITSLIPVVLLVMTISRVRHGPLFAITAVLGLGAMTDRCDWLRRKVADPEAGENLEIGAEYEHPLWKTYLAPAALTVLVVFIQALGIPAPVIGRGWAQLSPDAAPMCILHRLQNWQQEVPEGTAIVNDLNFGGFVIRFAPRLRVAIDDRCELYSDQELTEYWRMISGEPQRIEAVAKRLGVRGALVKTDSSLEVYLKNAADWTSVESCAEASLYQRTGADLSVK